jgi:hypothetical protein
MGPWVPLYLVLRGRIVWSGVNTTKLDVIVPTTAWQGYTYPQPRE